MALLKNLKGSRMVLILHNKINAFNFVPSDSFPPDYIITLRPKLFPEYFGTRSTF